MQYKLFGGQLIMRSLGKIINNQNKKVMAKMYFLKGDEDMCYILEHWKDYLAENSLKEIELFEAKRETGTGYFYCKEFGDIGAVNEGCGKLCEKYSPNNGKNGRCKHYGYCYEALTDKVIVLRMKSKNLHLTQNLIRNNKL